MLMNDEPSSKTDDISNDVPPLPRGYRSYAYTNDDDDDIHHMSTSTLLQPPHSSSTSPYPNHNGGGSYPSSPALIKIPDTPNPRSSLDDLTSSNTLQNAGNHTTGIEWSRANSIVANFWPASNVASSSSGANGIYERRRSHVEVQVGTPRSGSIFGSNPISSSSSTPPKPSTSSSLFNLRILQRALSRRLLLLITTTLSIILILFLLLSSSSSDDDFRSSSNPYSTRYSTSSSEDDSMTTTTTTSKWLKSALLSSLQKSTSGIGGMGNGFGLGSKMKSIVGGIGDLKGRVPPRRNPLKARIPLKSFRDNLKKDHGYITSFPYGGLTNQLIEMFKLVHLGQLLDRDPILSELAAVHDEGKNAYYSKFFDLDLFSYLTNVSLVEWHEVKIPLEVGTTHESLSCWGWADHAPLKGYNVETHFWPPPGQLLVPSSIEMSLSFPAIQVLASVDNRRWLDEAAGSMYGGWERAPAPPDKHLMCFENLFYVPSIHFVEGSVDSSYTIEEMSPSDPVWTSVGQHLHFNSHIEHIGLELLRFLLGHAGSSRPYIAVHIRRGDFINLGRVQADNVDLYKEAVAQVQLELKKRVKWSGQSGKRDLPVIYATDAADAKYVRKLNELGWIRINHQEFATDVRFGGWYPGILDSLLLSKAHGFVGTKMSTYSYLAARRVETWQGGVTKIAG